MLLLKQWVYVKPLKQHLWSSPNTNSQCCSTTTLTITKKNCTKQSKLYRRSKFELDRNKKKLLHESTYHNIACSAINSITNVASFTKSSLLSKSFFLLQLPIQLIGIIKKKKTVRHHSNEMFKHFKPTFSLHFHCLTLRDARQGWEKVLN